MKYQSTSSESTGWHKELAVGEHRVDEDTVEELAVGEHTVDEDTVEELTTNKQTQLTSW